MATKYLDDGAEKSDFPFLEAAGDYGPSCEHEAHCTIESYEDPAAKPPAFDKDGKRSWVAFHLKIAPEEGRVVNETFYMERKNRLFKQLGDLGVDVDVANNYAYDDEEVMTPGSPRDVIVQAGDPRKNSDGDFAYSSIKGLLPL